MMSDYVNNCSSRENVVKEIEGGGIGASWIVNIKMMGSNSRRFIVEESAEKHNRPYERAFMTSNSARWTHT